MVIFDSTQIFIESKTSIAAKITAIDAVISALFGAAAKAAINSDITEYSLDDGQTKIKETYRGPQAILASIRVFEAQKQYYINQMNGRKIRLVDSRNFPFTRTGNGYI